MRVRAYTMLEGSLYENNPSVIAWFEINTQDIQERALELWLYLAFILLCNSVALLVGAVPLCMLGLVLFCESIVWVPITLGALTASKEMVRQRCRHVAVARRGVYVDLVAEPGRRRLVPRVFVPYTTITQCVCWWT